MSGNAQSRLLEKFAIFCPFLSRNFSLHLISPVVKVLHFSLNVSVHHQDIRSVTACERSLPTANLCNNSANMSRISLKFDTKTRKTTQKNFHFKHFHNGLLAAG